MDYQPTRPIGIYDVKYELQGRSLQSSVTPNGCGIVTFLAENVRYERTGLHSKIAILHNGTYLDYDVFNVERSEDRRRLVLAAQRQFGKANSTHYPTEVMKADLDRFCLGLETEWQNRIPMITITGGEDFDAIMEQALPDVSGDAPTSPQPVQSSTSMVGKHWSVIIATGVVLNRKAAPSP